MTQDLEVSIISIAERDRLISMMSLDALIVADNSDLNVYKTSSKDNEVLGCCGPASKSASSCSASKNEEKEVEKQKDINLNQWAGKDCSFFCLFSPKRAHSCAGSFKIYAVKPRI